MDVKITDIDYDRKKVSLSIRALLNDARAAEEGKTARTPETAENRQKQKQRRGNCRNGWVPLF